MYTCIHSLQDENTNLKVLLNNFLHGKTLPNDWRQFLTLSLDPAIHGNHLFPINLIYLFSFFVSFISLIIFFFSTFYFVKKRKITLKLIPKTIESIKEIGTRTTKSQGDIVQEAFNLLEKINKY